MKEQGAYSAVSCHTQRVSAMGETHDTWHSHGLLGSYRNVGLNLGAERISSVLSVKMHTYMHTHVLSFSLSLTHTQRAEFVTGPGRKYQLISHYFAIPDDSHANGNRRWQISLWTKPVYSLDAHIIRQVTEHLEPAPDTTVLRRSLAQHFSTELYQLFAFPLHTF